MYRQRVRHDGVHLRELPGRPERERDDGPDVRSRSGPRPDPDGVETQRPAQQPRTDARGPELQVRLGGGHRVVGSGAGRVQHDRGEIEEHAVEDGRQVGDRGAGVADREPDGRGTVREVGQDRLAGRRRVGVGVPLADVPAVGHRAARPVAADEGAQAGHPDVREIDDVGGGVERLHRDAVGRGPRQRLDTRTGGRRLVEPPGAAQHLVDRRHPRVPVGSRPVDERQFLRLVGCVAVECRAVDLRGVHAPPPCRPAGLPEPGPPVVGGHGLRRRGGRSLCRGQGCRCRSRCVPHPTGRPAHTEEAGPVQRS